MDSTYIMVFTYIMEVISVSFCEIVKLRGDELIFISDFICSRSLP